MNLPDFDALAELHALPNPGAHPAHWAMFFDGDHEETLGSLIDRLTTQISPEHRPYLQIELADGSILNHAEIAALADREEFKEWIARRQQ